MAVTTFDVKNDERITRAAVSLVLLPGDERVGQQIQDVGSFRTVEQWIAGVGPKGACSRVRDAVVRAPTVLRNALDQGIRFVIPTDDEWPIQLNDLDTETPVGLWVRGAGGLALTVQNSIAIVGARACTTYGERVASELGTLASDHDDTVVSGAAFGIDAAAHRGALSAGGTTVAVLACGVDVAYPSAHQALLDRIAQAGLVVSEMPPGTTPRKQYFLVRNRIIAALSTQTVVVEAALRSGALSTAHWAADLGRTVWGVPGPITSASSAGVHRELAAGYMSIVPTLETLYKSITP